MILNSSKYLGSACYKVETDDIISNENLILKKCLKKKKTKIVATLGHRSKKCLSNVKRANVFRINFSQIMKMLRTCKNHKELNEELGFNASILADLQGPKLRVGVMKDEVLLPKEMRLFATGERFEGT